MIVPPFIPPQIEVPGNVAQESYALRLGFVRRVVVLYFSTALLVFGMSYLPRSLDLKDAAILVVSSLLALSFVRNINKGKGYEQILSGLFAPLLFVGLGQVLAWFGDRGLPPWVIILGPAAAAAYVLFCGRDLSFVGMWVLTNSFCTLVLFGLALTRTLTAALGIEAFLIAVVYLTFFVYDLAALLTRRRLDEELGAVLDLYRDVLNCITYPKRLISHWRKHRIWSLR